jgi:radical SAM superfamily enzyme YgiQ (UPF0313 family)
MMKILLTHSYFLKRDPKQLKNNRPYPPLATLYAAAILRANGFTVQLADLQFVSSPSTIKTYIEAFAPDALVIYDDAFNYLNKMCLTNMRSAAFEMQAIAKKYNLPVIVSSSDATDHLEQYFINGADYILIGEGEQTLLELMLALKANTAPEALVVKGLAMFKNKSVVKAPPRVVLKNLDELPPPAWDLLDIRPYRDIWLKHQGYFSINMVTTRGCPYKCNWCAKPVYGNRYNSHAPEAIVAQIKTLQQTMGVEHIWFADDIFGLKPGWIVAFNSFIQAQQIKIVYKIQSRADLLLEEETVKALAESGCEEVWIGAESGSQKILDAMDKGITLLQIKEATSLLKKYKIKPCFFLQFGYLGEQMQDIQATLELLKTLKPFDLGISISYPLPGTKFYERVKNELVVKQNWKDSDDLDMMFESSYSPEFYRLLQRFVHFGFRATQAIETIKNKRINKRVVLGPYYLTRKIFLKQKLKRLQADAADLL